MKDLGAFKGLGGDALREITSIGAGHAATALSQFIGVRMQLKVPAISILSASELPQFLGGPEAVVAGIYFRIYGHAPARMLLCLPKASLPQVLELLGAPSSPSATDLTALQQSALKELGNILCNAYLNALSTFLDMQFLPSVPALAVDMISSLLSSVWVEATEGEPQMLLIESQLYGMRQSFFIHLLLIPEEDSLRAMLKALASTTGVDPSV